MTTTVKVHVNGNYKATVKQDDREPVVIIGTSEKSFYLPHPAKGTFEISEVQMTNEEITERDK